MLYFNSTNGYILQYYRDYRKDIADPKSELFRLKVEYDAQQINK